MSKRNEDFMRAIDGHVRMYSTLPPEDTQDLLALAWRGARGSEHSKLKAELTRLRAENERLRVENIQMRFALGYPMPADLERHILPRNPFKCGVCDARAAILAALEAWPGMRIMVDIDTGDDAAIKLPLTENTDAKT